MKKTLDEFFNEWSGDGFELVGVGFGNDLYIKESLKDKRKKVIRRNCFETNSSSMHSILITKNDTHVKPEEFTHDFKSNDPYPDDYIYMYNGKWQLRDVEDGYGRYPFQLLTTFEEKFKYALCEFCGDYYGDEDEFYEKYNELERVASEIVPGLEKLDIYTKDVDIYLDKDGNEIKYKDLKYDGWDSEENATEYYYIDTNGEHQKAIIDTKNYLEVPAIGMIDHQSHGLLTNFLKDKGITLEEFLTNKKYVICIDGDEYCTFDKYRRSGLLDKNFITEIYDTSDGEDLEYQEWLEEQKENEENNSR